MNRLNLVMTAAVLALAMLLLTCAPLPLQSSSNGKQQLIRLSLEKEGVSSAVFTGQPIFAIVQTEDSIDYDSLAWHTGVGDPIRPDIPRGSKSDSFGVYLDWKSVPLNKDSVTGYPFDTVYISVGGGYQQSNTVRVNVLNIAPVLDSVKVNKTEYSALDPIDYAVTDTSSFTIQIIATDIDTKTLLCTGTSDSLVGGDLTLIQGKYAFSYSPPQGNFKDTLWFTINDRAGGTVSKEVLIYRSTPDIPPTVDSITIDKAVVSGGQNVYQVMFEAFDTLNFEAFAHDINAKDTVRYAWSVAQCQTCLEVDTTRKNQALYICGACTDTLKDTIIVVDTMRVSVSDGIDSVVKEVQVVHGRVDHAPVIDSLVVSDMHLQVADSATISCKAASVYPIRIYAHDPDGDKLRCTWAGGAAQRLGQKTDSTANLSTRDSTYVDTLSITLSDGYLSKRVTLYLNVAPRLPHFDSLTVDDSTYSGTDSVFYFMPGVLGDTIHFQLFADYDGNGNTDTLHYAWASKYKARLVAVSGPVAEYLDTLSPPLDDTISVTATGGNQKFTKRVALSFHAPSIDSIKVDVNTIRVLPAVIYDTITAATSLPLWVFAHDLDRGDTLSYTWTTKVVNTVDTVSPDLSRIDYHPQIDSAFTDSVRITVKDLQLNTATQLLLITVKK